MEYTTKIFLLGLAFVILVRIAADWGKFKSVFTAEGRRKRAEANSRIKAHFPEVNPHGQPILIRNLAFGFGFSGRFDFDEKTNSYVALNFLRVLGLPVIPVGAFRIIDSENGTPLRGPWHVLGSVPLRRYLTVQHLKQVYIPVLWVLAAIFIIFGILAALDR